MARATVKTGCMDWDDFRALEYFAIIYDIAIDEEQYNPEWCHLIPSKWSKPCIEPFEKGVETDRPWANQGYYLFSDSKHQGDLPGQTISAVFESSKLPFLQDLELPERLQTGDLALAALKRQSVGQISSLWRKLLLAKHVRADLQQNGATTALDALDKLGLALLRSMPLIECKIEAHNELQSQSVILKALFLNEAAACYQGYKSISIANDCQNLIKDVFGEGETPYELVASYSKAQGYLHVREYEKALHLFEETAGLDKAVSGQKRDYYAGARDPVRRHLRWPRQRKLFDAYVGYPSVLQSAETLLNLQRSWEAEERLKSAPPVPATPHQRARRHILEERINNDRKLNPPVADWSADGVATENLTLQRLAVDTERALSACSTTIASSSSEAPARALAQFAIARDKLQERMTRAARNRSEIDDTCLSWAVGLSVCKELLSFAHSIDAAGDCRDQVLEKVTDYFHLCIDEFAFKDVTAGLCIDQVINRGHADEVRQTLIRNLCGIHDLRNADVKPEWKSTGLDDLFAKIAQYLKGLLGNLTSKPPRSASKIEIRGWLEQKTLLAGDLLPDGSENSAARHKELRAFVGYGFVHPTEDDGSVSAAQRQDERSVWAKCKQYQCVKRGKPTDCGQRVLVRNPGFIPAVGGSKTLHHIDQLVDLKRDVIRERLYAKRDHDAGWHFVVLQRWNSFTPAMRASEGGGYFLFHAGGKSKDLLGPIDVGVVIDPGYGFVKNFVSEGFGVCDITAILITHDHPDHLADVGSLINLLVEIKKNRGGPVKKNSKVEMLVSRGAFERLIAQIESARDIFRDTVVLKPGTKYIVEGSSGKKMIVLRACSALHRDASHFANRSGFDAVGIISEIQDDSGLVRRVGIPSDTKWDEKISLEFTEEYPCDLICLHLDSIVPEGFPLISYFDAKKTSSKVLHEKQQLYLPGVVWYLEAIREHRANGMPTMVILSEFGEELAGGTRIDIARRLQAYTDERIMGKGKGKVVVLPGDVGLRVDPARQSIRCSCCHLEHPWTTPFHCETSGNSEQIFYVCPRCLRNLTQQERAESFSNRHPFLPGTKS
jgi:tetratricopeptide (TPR) repeat protein